MSGSRILAVAAATLLWVGLAGPAGAEQRRILLDGFTGDWAGLAPIHVDPAGDGGSSGIDITEIYAVNDEERLYLRFVVNTDLILQHEDNRLSLYLDTDNNAQTGFPQPPLGADLRWDFGDLRGFFFTSEGWTALEWDDVGLISAPTHSGPEFEICFDRFAVPDGVHPLFPGETIRLLFHDWAGGGDWAPNYGGAASYTFSPGPPPAPIDTLRIEPAVSGGCRLLTYNVLHPNLFDPWKQLAFGRLLNAIQPDVICFQEIYDHTAAQTRQVVENLLGGTWEASQVGDMVLLTRSSIIESWSLAGGRAGAHLIAPLGAFGHDLLVINCHLSCCAWGDAARQAQVDAVMAFVRDARTSGGQLDLTPENPIVITGDMNFIGRERQLRTLLTGDIADNATYGPDFAPDWDDTPLADAIPRHPLQAMTYTWYKRTSPYSPGRIDYIIFSDSNTEANKPMTLQTVGLPTAYLQAYGLVATDSAVASDHLPTFADLRPAQSGAIALEPAARGPRLVLEGTQPVIGLVRLRSLGGTRGSGLGEAALLEILDLSGRRLRTLAPEAGEAGGPVWTWDGRDAAGRLQPAGSYWARPRGAGERALRLVLAR